MSDPVIDAMVKAGFKKLPQSTITVGTLMNRFADEDAARASLVKSIHEGMRPKERFSGPIEFVKTNTPDGVFLQAEVWVLNEEGMN